MLKTLESQLHFVRAIREVDTTGVQPLIQLRDETEEGLEEITIGVEELKNALANETFVGKNKRPQQRRDAVPKLIKTEECASDSKRKTWDPLQTAQETVGAYFVVRSGNEKGKEKD